MTAPRFPIFLYPALFRAVSPWTLRHQNEGGQVQALPLSLFPALPRVPQLGRRCTRFPDHGEAGARALLLAKASCLPRRQQDSSSPSSRIHNAYQNTKGIFTALLATRKVLLLVPMRASEE